LQPKDKKALSKERTSQRDKKVHAVAFAQGNDDDGVDDDAVKASSDSGKNKAGKKKKKNAAAADEVDAVFAKLGGKSKKHQRAELAEDDEGEGEGGENEVEDIFKQLQELKRKKQATAMPKQPRTSKRADKDADDGFAGRTLGGTRK
jgi:hypothetical protein